MDNLLNALSKMKTLAGSGFLGARERRPKMTQNPGVIKKFHQPQVLDFIPGAVSWEQPVEISDKSLNLLLDSIMENGSGFLGAWEQVWEHPSGSRPFLGVIPRNILILLWEQSWEQKFYNPLILLNFTFPKTAPRKKPLPGSICVCARNCIGISAPRNCSQGAL